MDNNAPLSTATMAGMANGAPATTPTPAIPAAPAPASGGGPAVPSNGPLSVAQMASMKSSTNPTNPTSDVGSSWDAFDKETGGVTNPDYKPPATESAPGEATVDWGGYFKNVFDDYANAGKTAVGDVTEGAQDMEKGGVGNVAEGVEKSTLGEASNAVGAIFAPFTEGIKSLSDAIVKNVSTSPTLQKIASTQGVGAVIDEINGVKGSFDTFAQEHPGIASTISDAVNTAMGVAGSEVAPEGDVVKPVTDAAEAAKGAVSDAAKTVATIPSAASEAIDTFKQGQVENAKATAAKEWNTEVKNQEGKTQNIVTNAAAKGTDIPQILADRGISSHSLVGDNGKFDTGLKVNELKAEGDNLYNTTIKPLVDRATQMGTKLPLSDIMEKATAYLKGAKAPTNVVSDVIARIKSEFANGSEGSLKSEYGKTGMSPEDAEGEKHAHWNEINWSKNSPGVKSTAENLYNSAMGHAYQSSIEENLGAPKEVVKATNADIGKIRDTANFLQKIDGDTPAMKPQKGLPGRILQKSLQVGAGALGDLLGGPGGGVAGYFLTRDVASSVTKFLTGLPADVRDYWLKDLEAKSPEAAGQVQDYLEQQKNFKPAGLLESKPAAIPMPDSDTFNHAANAAKSGTIAPEKPGSLYDYFKNKELSQKAIGNVKRTPGRPAAIKVNPGTAKTTF